MSNQVNHIPSISHNSEPVANDVRRRNDAIIGRGQSTYTPTQVVVERAAGSCLWTADGRRLIDFASGVLVTNLGHSHPGFETRYREYAAQLPRSAYNMVTALQVEASERIVASMKANPNAEKVLWAASGSEGIQKAMWCAQHRYPDRPYIAATRGGFHGKKGLANDVTGETSANPNVRFVSFPLQDPKPESFYRDELKQLWNSCEGGISLLITEPYLGAKGSFHPPKWYHALLQEWCNEHDIAFIFDEVQACHGRTGNMYAFESYGVTPDMVVLGKGVANGEPAALVVGRTDLIDSLTYGEASDTFSCTPRAAAAVCAALDVFEEGAVLEHVRNISPIIETELRALTESVNSLVDVRGEGLVYGLEFINGEIANDAVRAAYLATESTGVHFLGPLAEKVIRVSPPLIITPDEIEEAFGMLRTAWAEL